MRDLSLKTRPLPTALTPWAAAPPALLVIVLGSDRFAELSVKRCHVAALLGLVSAGLTREMCCLQLGPSPGRLCR